MHGYYNQVSFEEFCNLRGNYISSSEDMSYWSDEESAYDHFYENGLETETRNKYTGVTTSTQYYLK